MLRQARTGEPEVPGNALQPRRWEAGWQAVRPYVLRYVHAAVLPRLDSEGGHESLPALPRPVQLQALPAARHGPGPLHLQVRRRRASGRPRSGPRRAHGRGSLPGGDQQAAGRRGRAAGRAARTGARGRPQQLRPLRHLHSGRVLPLQLRPRHLPGLRCGCARGSLRAAARCGALSAARRGGARRWSACGACGVCGA